MPAATVMSAVMTLRNMLRLFSALGGGSGRRFGADRQVTLAVRPVGVRSGHDQVLGHAASMFFNAVSRSSWPLM